MFIRDLVDVVMVKRPRSPQYDGVVHLRPVYCADGIFYRTQLSFRSDRKRVIADFRKKIFDHLHTLSLGFCQTANRGNHVPIDKRCHYRRGVCNRSSSHCHSTVHPATRRHCHHHLFELEIDLYHSDFASRPDSLRKTYGKRLKFLSKEIQDKLANATTIIEENISCIPVVKSFVRSKLEMNRFSDAIEDTFQSAKTRGHFSFLTDHWLDFILYSSGPALVRRT